MSYKEVKTRTKTFDKAGLNWLQILFSSTVALLKIKIQKTDGIINITYLNVDR